MRFRWVNAAAAVVLCSVIAVPVPAHAQNRGAPANAVTWTVDHTAKTITAEIRLTLVPAIGGAYVLGQEVADRIKKQIESVWNGYRYYCYDLIVTVDVVIDNTGGVKTSAPSDRLVVTINMTATPIRNEVFALRTLGGPVYPWDSNAPEAATVPYNVFGTRDPGSIWGGFDPEGGNLYAHEAGHLLGLHDTYEDVNDPATGQWTGRTRLLPGAPADLMSGNGRGIHQSTIDRAVERAGITKESLQCNYRIDHPQPGGSIYGLKCDAPAGTWLADGTYSIAGADGQQTWIIEITAGLPTGTMTGTYTYTDEQVMTPVAGVEVRMRGTATGVVELTFDDQLFAHMHLRETEHHFQAIVPGMDPDPATDTGAPLQSTDMIWDPIGRCTP